MKKLSILFISGALITGCAWTTPQVAAQRTIQTSIIAKDQAMKAWAVYVVQHEGALPAHSGPVDFGPLASARAKVSALNDEFDATAAAALDLSLSDASASAPPKLQKLQQDLVALIETFTKK